MKKTFKKMVICLAVVALAFIASSNTVWSAEKKHTINFSNTYVPKHPSVANGVMPWIDEVKKKSDGRLKIQYFGPNTLCPAKDQLPLLKRGVVDMAYYNHDGNVGAFPLAGVISLPFIFESAEAASLAAWELYKQYPEWQDEYKEMKALWHHTSAVMELSTIKKPVHTLEDLKGMRIICWTPLTRDYVKALGGEPLDISYLDTYLALQRGMADGVLAPLAPLLGLKIMEVTKHNTLMHLFINPFWGGMNLDKWAGLPVDLQKILSDMTGSNLARIFGKALDDGDGKAIQWGKEHGHTFYTLPPKELERWRSKVQFFTDNWLKDMEAKGYTNAKEILETAKELGVKFQKEISK